MNGYNLENIYAHNASDRNYNKTIPNYLTNGVVSYTYNATNGIYSQQSDIFIHIL